MNGRPLAARSIYIPSAGDAKGIIPEPERAFLHVMDRALRGPNAV